MKFKPPSTVAAEAHKKASMNLSSEEVTVLAKEVLLTEEEVKMWIEHLRDVSKRRKEGVNKAVATRSKAKTSKYKSKDKSKRDQRSSPPLDSLDGKFVVPTKFENGIYLHQFWMLLL